MGPTGGWRTRRIIASVSCDRRFQRGWFPDERGWTVRYTMRESARHPEPISGYNKSRSDCKRNFLNFEISRGLVIKIEHVSRGHLEKIYSAKQMVHKLWLECRSRLLYALTLGLSFFRYLIECLSSNWTRILARAILSNCCSLFDAQSYRVFTE
jgi:hypothetical protein